MKALYTDCGSKVGGIPLAKSYRPNLKQQGTAVYTGGIQEQDYQGHAPSCFPSSSYDGVIGS